MLLFNELIFERIPNRVLGEKLRGAFHHAAYFQTVADGMLSASQEYGPEPPCANNIWEFYVI